MAPGPLQLMAKRPKFSLFLVAAGSTSIGWFYDYSFTMDVMRMSCKKAAALGDERLRSSLAKTRHVTVILNPVAGKRKSKKLYNKWVEPLLHLAGIKVSLIETESPNQAYDLMKIMSNCDGVAIVGGDGTVHEAVNGLLHRPDSSKAVRDFPIAIIPTGQYNSIARYIYQHISYRNQKELLIQSTLRLIEKCAEKHDVLKITPLDQKSGDQAEIFALRDVRYGLYQDNFVKLSGYKLYQSFIKPYWLRLQRIINSKFLKPQIESISFTKPCIGCSRCYEKHRLPEVQMTSKEEVSTNRRWWSVLAPVAKSTGPSADEIKELELSKRENPQCDKWKMVENTDHITDFRASMMGDKKVRLSLSKDSEYNSSEIMEVQDVKLRIATDLDKAKQEEDAKKKSKVSQSSESEENESTSDKKKDDDSTVKFLIDGQPYQAHSIEVTSINKAVTIYAGDVDMFE